MRLIVDAMGGDNAPEAIVSGAIAGIAREKDMELILVGDENRVARVIRENALSLDRVRIVHAPSVVEMHDDPLCILKSKKDSSMARGFALLRDGEGDAFLSAGSTGAMLVGASSRIYKNRVEGVRRCAIGTVLPLEKPVFLLDSGANPSVSPEDLCQFARMGALYAEKVLEIPEPRVGLLNNGAEETKGTETYVEANRLLREEKGIRFIGNVEGRDVPLGACDVLVCDGFAGNVVLKLSEGFGKFISHALRDIFGHSAISKMAYLLVKPRIRAFRKKMSYEQYGGAPLLGCRKPVIKAHGSSSAKAIEHAVRQAKKIHASDFARELEKMQAQTEREEA